MNETLKSIRESPSKRAPRDQLQTVTDSTFSQVVIEGAGPIAVEFMSYGCAHCRLIEPVIQQVAQMVGPKEKICRVNIAIEPELANNYEIQGTPTFIMFLNGSELERVEGPQPTLSSVLTMVTKPFE